MENTSMREALEAARNLLLPQCNGGTAFAKACGETVNKIMDALKEERTSDGNAAAMREALVGIRALIADEPDGTPMIDAMNESDRQRKVVRLATCDIGKALCVLHLEDERRTKYMWTCRDGREIAVEDMSDEHLTNTIEMLERKMYEREIVEENRREVFG